MLETSGINEIPEGNFPINLRLITKYQRSEPILMAKYEDGTYHKGSFRGIINIGLNLIKCEDKIVIPKKIQSYVLHWYHTYLLHPIMDRNGINYVPKFVLAHHSIYRPEGGNKSQHFPTYKNIE